MSFDDKWDNDGFLSSCSRVDAEHFYKAGQQSKQADVDELRKRIDEINKLVDLWREDYVTLVKYDDGNRYCLEDCINRVINILKGDQS